MNYKQKVCVVGSLNMDLVTETKVMPKMGETINGLSFTTYSGGKGGDQAVAASRLGADVVMIGCVGQDSFGDILKNELIKDNINIDYLETLENTPTGTATIIVANNDNCIILQSGANGQVSIKLIESYIDILLQSDIIILQNEIPLEINKYIIEKVKGKVKIIYNPAPYIPAEVNMLKSVDILIMNEHEASDASGISVCSFEDAKNAIRTLNSYGIDNVIITMGKLGVVYNDGKEYHTLGCLNVPVADTTAAGDTFCGAVAASISSGINEAVKYAVLASNLTVTGKGAQASIPSREEVLDFAKDKF